jgi:peptidoglycan/LPS O-acetylase OafA/YrhL
VHEVHLYPEISFTMTMHYIALFIMGILLATHLAAVSRWYASLRSVTRKIFGLVSFGLYELTGSIVQNVVPSHRLTLDLAGDWGTALGAIGIIIASLNSAYLRKMLGTTIPVFLGRISYSLYLTHIPLLLAIVFTFNGKTSDMVLVFPFYAAAALALAYTFCIFVEEPFMRIGRQFKLPSNKSGAIGPESAASIVTT